MATNDIMTYWSFMDFKLYKCYKSCQQ